MYSQTSRAIKARAHRLAVKHKEYLKRNRDALEAKWRYYFRMIEMLNPMKHWLPHHDNDNKRGYQFTQYKLPF